MLTVLRKAWGTIGCLKTSFDILKVFIFLFLVLTALLLFSSFPCPRKVFCCPICECQFPQEDHLMFIVKNIVTFFCHLIQLRQIVVFLCSSSSLSEEDEGSNSAQSTLTPCALSGLEESSTILQKKERAPSFSTCVSSASLPMPPTLLMSSASLLMSSSVSLLMLSASSTSSSCFLNTSRVLSSETILSGIFYNFFLRKLILNCCFRIGGEAKTRGRVHFLHFLHCTFQLSRLLMGNISVCNIGKYWNALFASYNQKGLCIHLCQNALLQIQCLNFKCQTGPSTWIGITK